VATPEGLKYNASDRTLAAAMAVLTTSQSGNLGELWARVHLSRPVGGRYRRALFQPTPLGGTYPTVDLIVDVLDPESEPIGFFFAQVKATQSASRGGARLSLTIHLERYRRLTRLRAPAYLIGVDISDERSYIMAATPPAPAAFPSISRDYPLTDDKIRVALYREVVSFWTRRPRLGRSEFRDV
jgi:hypothetical protein